MKPLHKKSLAFRYSEALSRIEELERRVRDLEARPVLVPYAPQPWKPNQWWQAPYPVTYKIDTTCGSTMVPACVPNQLPITWGVM